MGWLGGKGTRAGRGRKGMTKKSWAGKRELEVIRLLKEILQTSIKPRPKNFEKQIYNKVFINTKIWIENYLEIFF